jgi:hypothetical protein
MNIDPYSGNGLFGIRFQESPYCDDVPRMQTNPDFAKLMPPEFVADLNAWMIKFFGRHDLVYAVDNGRTIICGPNTINKLRRELNARS